MFLIKKWALKRSDKRLCVSNYTKNQLVLRNKINPIKMGLFPNTIDPYFSLPQSFEKPAHLLKRYGLTSLQSVILTLSRLVSSEKYKGYDKVIAALPRVLEKFPNAIYILAGKYDEGEKMRIEGLLQEFGVSKHVILTGYLPEAEVTDHYCLADLFIMPSRKEGFGIVFLEALACGSQVIGGNQDGTVDALHNGALGSLINPTKIDEIADAIIKQLVANSYNSPIELQTKVLNDYQFSNYKKRLQHYLNL